MNLKSEKGNTGIDITVALIVVLVFMSILGVLFFSISKVSKGIERQSQATYIATDVIEAIKTKKYSDVELTNGQKEITNSGSGYNYIVNENTEQEKTVLLGRNIQLEAGYTCKINVENFIPTKYRTDEDTDLIKVVTVTVEYKVANEVKNVSIKTALLREM